MVNPEDRVFLKSEACGEFDLDSLVERLSEGLPSSEDLHHAQVAIRKLADVLRSKKPGAMRNLTTQADAKRYQYLRDEAKRDDKYSLTVIRRARIFSGDQVYRGDELDTAIDDASTYDRRYRDVCTNTSQSD